MPLDPEVAYWAEMSEALAAADLCRAAADLPDDPVGALVARPGDGVAFAFRKLDIPFFNRAIGVGVARPAVESDVDDVVTFFDGAERETIQEKVIAELTGPAGERYNELRGEITDVQDRFTSSLEMVDEKITELDLARAELALFLHEWIARIPSFGVTEGWTEQTEGGLVWTLNTLTLTWPRKSQPGLS